MQQHNIFWGPIVLTLLALSPLPARTLPSFPPIAIPFVETAHPDSTGSGNPQQGKTIECAARECFTLAQPDKSAKTYTFQELWNLIRKFQKAHDSHFTPELIACLMWEESGFRLIENPESHALGFGQVLPATLREINQRYDTKFTRAQLLSSPEMSVEATVLALEVAWDWKKEKVGALFAYAGGIDNFEAVRKWLTAEPHLIRAMSVNTIAYERGSSLSSRHIISALEICSQPGFDPESLF